MASFGWEICSSGGLLTVAVSGVFVVLAFLSNKLQIFLPASLTFLGQRAMEMPKQVKNCS